MTYVPRRRPFRRRPKDVLGLALKSLWPGDELLCTNRSYNGIKDRVNAFALTKQDRRLAAIPSGEIWEIRRVA